MKKLILLFIVLLFDVGLSAQNSAYEKNIYKDFGTFKVADGDNIISVSAFVTIEKVDSATHEDDVTQYQQYQTLKEQKKPIVTKELYHYEVYMVSKSVYEGEKTSTWLYGTRIFVNGEDILSNQFPDGFVVSIKTEPTCIYTYHSDKTDIKFEIKWEKSVYEPRIRK